jgi:hypothetical protein
MASNGSRTLKLSILADVDNLLKGFNTANKKTDDYTTNLANFAKKAVAAFALVGGAAAAFATQSIKNALADEAAQRKLEETIRASTNATAAQTAAVSQYIDKTSIAIGVTDDELRPALSRLIRSTNDITEAQDLLNLALDITAATGKPLEAVSNALGKAYDGNATSLARLGLGLDANLIKSKDTDAIFNQLTRTFGNFAENEAETTSKKFERLKIAMDEAKETIGAALLPLVERLATYLLNVFVPNMNAFIAGMTGSKIALDESTKGAYAWGEQAKKVIETVIRFKDEIIALAAVIASVFVVSKFAAFVTGTITLIQSLIKAYNALKASSIVAGVAAAFALNPLLGVGAVAVAAGVLAAANALAGQGDGDTSVSGGGGLNPIQSGSYLSGSSVPKGGGYIPSGGGLIPSGGGGGGGGGIGGTGLSTAGGSNLMDFLKDFTDINKELENLSTDVSSGKIYRKDAIKKLDEISTFFDRRASEFETYQEKITPSSSFNVGSFRMGEAATMVTVNFNGVIGDNEAAARVITEVIEESAARGGAGTTFSYSRDR